MATNSPVFSAEWYAEFESLVRDAREAVAEAQEESRRLGVPNVYCINGRIYYELPNGELSLNDPYVENNGNGAADGKPAE